MQLSMQAFMTVIGYNNHKYYYCYYCRYCCYQIEKISALMTFKKVAMMMLWCDILMQVAMDKPMSTRMACTV